MHIKIVKETKNKNWLHSAKEGFPIRMSFFIDLSNEQIQELDLKSKADISLWLWDRKNRLRNLIFQELNDLVGERKLHWRTESQREYHTDRYLHIYVADDEWLITARLKDAIVEMLPRTVAILEKDFDTIPVHPDAN